MIKRQVVLTEAKLDEIGAYLENATKIAKKKIKSVNRCVYVCVYRWIFPNCH